MGNLNVGNEGVSPGGLGGSNNNSWNLSLFDGVESQAIIMSGNLSLPKDEQNLGLAIYNQCKQIQTTYPSDPAKQYLMIQNWAYLVEQGSIPNVVDPSYMQDFQMVTGT